MKYDLWDIESGNMIALYATQAEALEDVRDLLVQNSTAYARSLSLGGLGEAGRRWVIAAGDELLALATTAIGA
jgi:hypothetical protein